MEQLLEIYYERIIYEEEVTLSTQNCYSYGYLPTSIVLDDVNYTVYYKQGDTVENIVPYEYDKENKTCITKIILSEKTTYNHIAPPCSKYQISFADVDKEGSGRNSQTGEMFRERVGKYIMLTIAWNLIPNTKEYNNWYKILTHLPPMVYLKLLLPSGEIVEKKMYRGDISTDLYLFVDDSYGYSQIWQGLQTTFTQWDIDEYDNAIEPILEEVN